MMLLRLLQVMLRPGEGLGGEGGLDLGAVIKSEEAKLQVAQVCCAVVIPCSVGYWD